MRKVALVVLMLGMAGCALRPSESQKASLAATEAVVNEHVKAGKLTPAEGRLIVAQKREEIERSNRDAYWRAVNSGGDGPAVYQPVGGGTYIKY